jgi:hypothetical protein
MPACIQERGGLHMQKQGERIRNGRSASAQWRVFGCGRIEEGSVRRKSGAAVGRRIYVCCGSPTMLINGRRGWGDVASKRLDCDVRPFMSSVELKVVNFAGNCFCHEIAESKRHAALERTDKIREYALSISSANIGSIPYRSRAAENLSISLYREIQHDLRSVRLVKWLQAISKMGLHVAHIDRGLFL